MPLDDLAGQRAQVDASALGRRRHAKPRDGDQVLDARSFVVMIVV
jgi:hypothetical protein